MTRVSGIGTGGALPGKPKAAASTGGFSVAGDVAAGAAHETAAAPGVMLSGMLALQEVEAETVQDKAARRHGFAILKALGELQKDMLAGAGPGEAQIAALGRLCAEVSEATDPGLAAILDTIRLRAKIELLRRGVNVD